MFVLFILLAPSVLTAQHPEQYKNWHADTLLSWQDFEGFPPIANPMNAQTRSGIFYEADCQDGSFYFQVYAVFDRHKSWARSGAGRTDELLAHEQLHFDITELFARKLRRDISELDMPCSYDEEELSAHYKKITTEWKATQKQYDLETNHGKDTKEQKRWRNEVAKQLTALNRFIKR